MKGIFKELSDYLFIALGALLASFSVASIILPNDAIDYGTAGIGIILNKLTGLNLSICVFITFIPFLIAGAWTLGKNFVLKASIGSVFYMGGLQIFEDMHIALATEHFIAVCFGGALLGIGLSLILRFGGCIDGSEILANILVNKISQKKGKSISMTGILVCFNALVYSFVFFIIDKNSALLSLLVYIVATSIIDHFTDRFDCIKQVTIITKYPSELVCWIKDDMHKTCTIMDSKGAIAGNNTTLICYVTYFELQKLRENIKRIDKTSFVTVSNIEEIMR